VLNFAGKALVWRQVVASGAGASDTITDAASFAAAIRV
jgi:hypothetical protein